MSYKSKIVPEGNGYVGHLFLNDQVVFTTKNHKDPVMASRELGAHAGRITAPPAIPNNSPTGIVSEEVTKPSVMRNVSNSAAADSSTGTPTSTSSPRRCCGRG